jgi:hypothetical protein
MVIAIAAALFLAGHLGGTQPGQGLAQVPVALRCFLKQSIELIADGAQTQAAERGVEVLHHPSDVVGVTGRNLGL